MKRIVFALMMSLVAGSCSDGVSLDPDPAMDEAAVLGFSGSLATDPGSRHLGNLHRLPDNLALSAAQKTQIDALIARFEQATKADRDALAAIGKQAHDAAAAGKTREEVQAILAQGNAIRERLHTAETALRTAIDALLTAEQKAWIASQDGPRCTPITLTDAQKTQIASLVTAFQQANSADLAAVRAAHEQAHEAMKNGATKEQITAILEAVRPAMDRIRTAEAALATAIKALLTPEQQASGCFMIHPAPGGPGHSGPGRRG